MSKNDKVIKDLAEHIKKCEDLDIIVEYPNTTYDSNLNVYYEYVEDVTKCLYSYLTLFNLDKTKYKKINRYINDKGGNLMDLRNLLCIIMYFSNDVLCVRVNKRYLVCWSGYDERTMYKNLDILQDLGILKYWFDVPCESVVDDNDIEIDICVNTIKEISKNISTIMDTDNDK